MSITTPTAIHNLTTISRTSLRRKLSTQYLLEPFFEDVMDGVIQLQTNGTTTTIILPTGTELLWPSAKHWKGSTVYIVDGALINEERRIIDWTPGTRTLTVAIPFASAPQTNTKIEIHSLIPAQTKNDIINNLISQSWPYFFEEMVHEIVIPDETGEITATHNFPSDWRHLTRVDLEPYRQMMGPYTATAVPSTTQITVDGAAWDSDIVNYEVAIEYGSGAGYHRTVASVAGDIITLSSAIAGLTSGTLPRFQLKKDEDLGAWSHVDDVQPKGSSTLESLHISPRLMSLHGRKIRIYGLRTAPQLTSEGDVTVIPEEWLLYEAASRIVMNLSKKEPSQNFTGKKFAATWDAQVANEIKRTHSFRWPPSTYWIGTYPVGVTQSSWH